MSRIIAGIYEIEKKIGAGGGGIVYMGRHLRLKKPVVLKADKRTLNAENEALRREVDMLKELNHTYIPQVYDFVQEDGVVYTVMDFIEGESLDKLLGRNQIPAQPQVIQWACQLLKALNYLHSRPPYGILHGDIKPANIMLKPDGDICLIDFNIALALGEDGAVKVGFSRGYASPEHYGADYISGQKKAAVGEFPKKGIRGDIDREKTLLLGSQTPGQSFQGTAGGTKAIMLDARSDIYSLGATLYHLLSGQRPPQDASEVEPLGENICSAEISDILCKAMALDPDMRYQSAEEMLAAFLQLHKKDRRMVRHRRNTIGAAAILTTVFLTGGFSSFVGLKQMEQRQSALTLAEYSSDALEAGNVEAAVELALAAVPSGSSIWEAEVTPQAQKALADALGVYRLEDGFQAAGVIELPSVPFGLAVSSDGSRLAVSYAYETAVFDIDERKEEAVLPMQESALADVIFADNSRLVYAGVDGVTAYDIEEERILWTGESATTLALSADCERVAAVNRAEDYASVYRISDGKKIADCFFNGMHMQTRVNDIFADPGDAVFALNEDGSLLAASFDNGGLYIFNLEQPDRDIVIYEESDYQYFTGGFHGKYFAYGAGGKEGQAVFGLIDCAEGAYLGGYESQEEILLQADERGIFLANENLLVELLPETMKERELAYTGGLYITGFSVGDGYALAATNDNGFSFYDDSAHFLSGGSGTENSDFTVLAGGCAVVGNRNEPSLRLLKLEGHEEAQLFSYDAGYEHEEARMSQDGRTAMLFGIYGFRIYDKAGRMLAEVELPEPGAIYDQQFVKSREGSWLEVVWYDGTVRCYSASDGRMMRDERGKAPEKDLYEEFYTKEYRITSSLHTAPEVYEIHSGKQVAVLEEDSYLTYVTETGNYIITEYVSAAGERYGILLDKKLEKLADLPGLCDVAGDTLIFDYGTGNLRQCRLYSLQELVILGETYAEKAEK